MNERMWLESAYVRFHENGTHDGQTDHSDGYLGRRESGHGDELEVGITDQFPGQPEEGFLEVVVGLGGDVVVLEVLLAVENDRLGFHFTILRIEKRNQ